MNERKITALISKGKPPCLSSWTWKHSSCLMPKLSLVVSIEPGWLCLYICHEVLTARHFSGSISDISLETLSAIYDSSLCRLPTTIWGSQLVSTPLMWCLAWCCNFQILDSSGNRRVHCHCMVDVVFLCQCSPCMTDYFPNRESSPNSCIAFKL